MHSLLEIISFTGFIQGILVGSLAIFHEKFNKSEFTILGILILVMSLDCLCQSTLVVTKYPIIYWINNGNLFLFGPLIYFFVKSVKTEKPVVSQEVLLHLTPFIVIKVGTLILGPTGLGDELLSNQFYKVLNQSITVHGTTYAIITLILASRNKSRSDTSLKKFTFWLAIIYTFGWLSSFLGRQFELYDKSTSMIMWNVSYLALLILILAVTVQLMLYSGTTQGQVGRSKKYERSTLTQEEGARLAEQLNQLLHEKRLFLDPELNRTKLAEYLNVTPHNLSQILNKHINKNFSDYINEYRLAEAKKRLIDPDYKEYTILAIAFDSGFKSKSSFQRLFKKHTGYNPSTYLEAMKNATNS